MEPGHGLGGETAQRWVQYSIANWADIHVTPARLCSYLETSKDFGGSSKLFPPLVLSFVNCDISTSASSRVLDHSTISSPLLLNLLAF